MGGRAAVSKGRYRRHSLARLGATSSHITRLAADELLPRRLLAVSPRDTGATVRFGEARRSQSDALQPFRPLAGGRGAQERRGSLAELAAAFYAPQHASTAADVAASEEAARRRGAARAGARRRVDDQRVQGGARPAHGALASSTHAAAVLDAGAKHAPARPAADGVFSGRRRFSIEALPMEALAQLMVAKEEVEEDAALHEFDAMRSDATGLRRSSLGATQRLDAPAAVGTRPTLMATSPAPQCRRLSLARQQAAAADSSDSEADAVAPRMRSRTVGARPSIRSPPVSPLRLRSGDALVGDSPHRRTRSHTISTAPDGTAPAPSQLFAPSPHKRSRSFRFSPGAAALVTGMRSTARDVVHAQQSADLSATIEAAQHVGRQRAESASGACPANLRVAAAAPGSPSAAPPSARRSRTASSGGAAFEAWFFGPADMPGAVATTATTLGARDVAVAAGAATAADDGAGSVARGGDGAAGGGDGAASSVAASSRELSAGPPPGDVAAPSSWFFGLAPPSTVDRGTGAATTLRTSAPTSPGLPGGVEAASAAVGDSASREDALRQLTDDGPLLVWCVTVKVNEVRHLPQPPPPPRALAELADHRGTGARPGTTSHVRRRPGSGAASSLEGGGGQPGSFFAVTGQQALPRAAPPLSGGRRSITDAGNAMAVGGSSVRRQRAGPLQITLCASDSHGTKIGASHSHLHISCSAACE